MQMNFFITLYIKYIIVNSLDYLIVYIEDSRDY